MVQDASPISGGIGSGSDSSSGSTDDTDSDDDRRRRDADEGPGGAASAPGTSPVGGGGGDSSSDDTGDADSGGRPDRDAGEGPGGAAPAPGTSPGSDGGDGNSDDSDSNGSSSNDSEENSGGRPDRDAGEGPGGPEPSPETSPESGETDSSGPGGSDSGPFRDGGQGPGGPAPAPGTTPDSGINDNDGRPDRDPGEGPGGAAPAPETTQTGSQGDSERPNTDNLEFDDNTVDRSPDEPGTSMADIGLATQLEDQLSEQYGDRNFEFAYVGDDVVARFQSDEGGTRYVPVGLSDDSERAVETAQALQREERREEVASEFGVDASDIGLTEDGQVEFQSEDARRQALREQYGEGAEITRLGEGAFRVETPGTPQPTQGPAPAPGSGADSGTVVVPFGEEGEQTLQDLRDTVTEQQTVDTGRQGQADINRGNLGDPREIRREDAAEQVSNELGIPVDENDVNIVDSPGGEQRLELSGEAQRAALLSSSSEFLNRDAQIEKTDDGQYRVSLPGDSDAMEEALTQKLRTGEAFGGETTISAFGHTLNLDQATSDFAGAVGGAAGAAGDIADRANLFSGRPPGVGGDAGQNVVGASSTSEASENLMIQTLEGGAAAVGDVPRGLLELGEAATDPTAYRVGAEATMMGVRRVDDVATSPVSSARSAGAGFVGTAERVDALAQENPEAAAGVTAGVLGGAAVTAASFAAAPAALSRVASASPRGARAIAATLDPIRTTARVGGRATRTVASRGASGARSAAQSVRQTGPDVSLVRDPDAGLVDVTPEARQEIRSGLSSRTPSREGIRSGLADRIGATRQRARSELASVSRRRQQVADTVSDASARDLIDGGRAVSQRVRDEASGAAQGAAFSAEAAVFNARRAARNTDASDLVPSRLSRSGDSGSEPLMGRVEGRAKGAAVDAGLAARRVRETSVRGLAPSRPSLPDRPSLRGGDGGLGRVEGAVASLNVNSRLAAQRARDLDAGDLLPSRPSLGDGDSLVGPVRGRAAGAAASGEAALRQLRNTNPSDLAPSRPSTPSVRDLTLRVEPSRPPRTPMTRTIDADDADLTDAEADVFDTFDGSATADSDGGNAGRIGQNILGQRSDLGTSGGQQASSATPAARQLTRSRQRDPPESLSRDTFEAGPMVGSPLIGGTTSSFESISSQATQAEVASSVQDQPLLQQQDNIGLATFGPEETQAPTVTQTPSTTLLETPSITQTPTPTTIRTPDLGDIQGPTFEPSTPTYQPTTPGYEPTTPTTRGRPDLPDLNGDGEDDGFGFGVNTADLEYQLGANIFGGL